MHKNKIFIVASLPFVLLLAGESFALKDKCDGLSEEEMKLAKKVMSETYCYACCDETVSECLKKKKTCKLAVRLANEICIRVKRGQDEEEIKSSLGRRAKSMMPSGKKYKIDTTVFDAWVGDPDSKVEVVAYMCARCPYCAKITPKLYKSMKSGSLKGKVKMHIKIFPIKSHKHGVEANLALAAAEAMGKFWPYLLKAYEEFDEFDLPVLVPWAKKVGIKNVAKFKKLMNDQEVRKKVVDSKKEGLVNGVTGTPTFYINGRKYTADYRMTFFTDALMEEYDRVSGDIYQ
jgi:protein-disulfide isomerase